MNPTVATRQANLARLIAECGGNASTAARRANKDRRQFSAWSTGRKAISDESARELEQAFGKPAGWMDREHLEPSRPSHIEPRTPSQPQRIDAGKMRDAMTLLRHLAELRDVPELVSDPVALAIAYEVVVEFDTPLTNSNVLDLTKRLAATLRGMGMHRKEERLRELAGLLSARMDDLKAQKVASRRSHKETFRMVADELPIVLWTAGPDGVPTYHSRHWHETFGQNADYLELAHPDDREGVIQSWMASVKMGLPYRHIARFRLPDGSYRALITHAHPFIDEDGSILYWVGSSTELPEAKTFSLRSVA